MSRAAARALALCAALAARAGADVNTDWREGMAPKLEGPYCGRANCYELLGVPRSAESAEIRKAYRALAKEAHPDKNPSADRAQFQRIASAYEVLMSEGSRRAYDWGLDNPQLLAFHLAQFRPIRQLPNADVRLILLLGVLVLSALQWTYRTHNYARGRLLAKLQLRRRFEELFAAALAEAGLPPAEAKAALAEQLEQLAKEEGARSGKAASPKPAKKVAAAVKAAAAAKPPAAPPAVVRALASAEERLLVESGLCGVYLKPALLDMPIVQLALAPLTLARWLAWYVRWLVMVRRAWLGSPRAPAAAHSRRARALTPLWPLRRRLCQSQFDLRGLPYGEAEAAYLTRKAAAIPQQQWDALPQEERAALLEQRLWAAGEEEEEEAGGKKAGAKGGKGKKNK